MTKNNFIKRTVSSLLAVSCCAFSMSGCDVKSKKNTSETVSQSKATIAVASSFGSSDDSAPEYIRLLEDFAKVNPKITVINDSAKADDHWKASVRGQFNAGKEPDVMFFYNSFDVRNIIEKEQVVSIKEIQEVYPDFAKNIDNKALEDIQEFNGKTYAVPIMRFWEGLFYNEAIFKENGIASITDWNSLEKAIKTLKAKGITPIAASFSDVPNYWIEHSILSAGGVKEHSVNPKKPSDVPKSWAEGLDTLHELYKMGAFSSECILTQQELAINQFNRGNAAMILEGSWINIAPSIMPDIRVTAMPAKSNVKREDKGVISGLTMGWYISRKAWNDPQKRDAVVKYVQFMSSDDAISKLCRGNSPTTEKEIVLQRDQSPKITEAAYSMCQENITEMPIDSRINKAAWEYLISKIPSILRGEAKSTDVLKKVAEHNSEGK